ncbi:cellulose synthase complex periplasmic endoglucanase BcsZ [Solimonas flava]|uniref:cellulose synthase complex periplasmic endoglucanase BcsZ n=1 Tax=Solimonas flava TaxID=415849 RepID=UPI0006866F12|nr:cellulose synthase complex periplasmic endoglucanase BcsZ [Solimonas flava]
MIRPMRWLACLLTLLSAQAARAAPPPVWDDWRAFDDAFIDVQGRVIDWTERARTVSEGQAYALFFALVANDRKRFAQILDWTEKNLAYGNLRQNLPAWHWGARDDGSWGVIDANPASDADLWLAYTLIEAGRLWKQPDYRATGRALLAQIAAREVVRMPAGPYLLLPAPQGFVGDDNAVRINPSYYVPLQLAALQDEDPQGPWLRLLRDYVALLPQIAPLGRVPDWTMWRTDRIVVDPKTGGVGSYDAIRAYLWAGLAPINNPHAQQMRLALLGFRDLVAELKRAPEKWTTGNSGVGGEAPPGFYAALLPYLLTVSDPDSYQLARTRLAASRVDGLYGKPARYYDQVLTLFGKGYVDGRYRFDAHGRVIPSWQ